MRARQQILQVSRLLLAMLVSAECVGCVTKKTEATKPAPSASAAPAPSITVTAFVMADAAPPDPRKAPQLAGCPNAVDTAMTSILDVSGGVELRIVAKDLGRATEIRSRAFALVESASKGGAPGEHADGVDASAAGGGAGGGGAGGGHAGGCPVVLKNTVVSQLPIGGGAAVTVKAKDAARVDALRKETRERQAALEAGGTGEGSHRKVALCPSTVPAAQTRVVNTSTGVDVIVTSDAPASIEQIRVRGKACLARANDPGGAEHEDGEGGGLGRCPVVTQGVVLAAKDTAGGAVFTILPKKGPVADLQAEAKRRFDKLGPPQP